MMRVDVKNDGRILKPRHESGIQFLKTTLDMSWDQLMNNILSDDPSLQAHFRVKFDRITNGFQIPVSLSRQIIARLLCDFFFNENKRENTLIRELTQREMIDNSFIEMMILTLENLLKDCCLKIRIYSRVSKALFSQ